VRRIPPAGRVIRAIGFDDAPFERRRGASVRIAGVVCAGTRFEGMVFGTARQDGWNATEVLRRLLARGKFLPQLHLVLLDGIAFGGFNVVDLEALASALACPCVAVMRSAPDLPAVERALRRLPQPERRLRLLRRAGPIHRLTDRGNVPEPLRLAHLVGAAVVCGESGRRA
jgi:endonuclease V-like protein UPF0215 family